MVSPLAFMNWKPACPVVFDGNELDSRLAKLMDGHVTYLLGAKCSHYTSTEPEAITQIDCSGLVRYLFYWITSPHYECPGGSSNQEDWFEARYTKVKYHDAARSDGILRIAFRHRRSDSYGHVWFILNGRTIESTEKGAGSGPKRLGWAERIDEAHSCFLLGAIYPMRFT